MSVRFKNVDMEGRIPPLVFFLMYAMGGEVSVTDEEMERVSTGNFELETWYDVAKCRTMYRLKENTVVDGEVVPDVVQERRSITDGS